MGFSFLSFLSFPLFLNFWPTISMGFFGKIIFTLSVLIFMHASFSAIQYRRYFQILQLEENESLPIDIIVETFIGLVLFYISTTQIFPSFKRIDVKTTSLASEYDQVNHRHNFMVFNHRGKVFGHQQKKQSK